MDYTFPPEHNRNGEGQKRTHRRNFPEHNGHFSTPPLVPPDCPMMFFICSRVKCRHSESFGHPFLKFAPSSMADFRNPVQLPSIQGDKFLN